MISFRELSIGTGQEQACERCLRIGRGSASSTPAPIPAPASFADIEARIATIAPAAVMMRDFEPFKHPDLPRIVTALTGAGVRRIAARTDATALVNPADARGCIDAGIRAFEVPIPLPSAATDATLRGIAQAQDSAAELGHTLFICGCIELCQHTAPRFFDMAQTALAARVDALRIECPDPQHYLDRRALADIHTLATQAGICLFGDGCEAFLKGAVLYEVVS